jgi:hypothetical protein
MIEKNYSKGTAFFNCIAVGIILYKVIYDWFWPILFHQYWQISSK